MIARLWRGETRGKDADGYAQAMRELAAPDYRATPGNLGAWLLRRDLGDRSEFLFLTLWRDRAAIAAFAGEPVERARYYDVDRDYLLAFPEEVEHFEVVGEWRG
jgi:heme-degrading monooxygenase HmoA